MCLRERGGGAEDVYTAVRLMRGAVSTFMCLRFRCAATELLNCWMAPHICVSLLCCAAV